MATPSSVSSKPKGIKSCKRATERAQIIESARRVRLPRPRFTRIEWAAVEARVLARASRESRIADCQAYSKACRHNLYELPICLPLAGSASLVGKYFVCMCSSVELFAPDWLACGRSHHSCGD